MTALALSLPDRRRLLGMAVPFVAVVGSMIVGLLLIAASGKDVPDAIEAFMDGAFGSAFAVGASINRAVALSLVGLGFILAFRANLTNVGGEGQIAVGGIAATALGLWPPIANLPLGLAVIVPLLGGTLAGALLGRHRRRHEGALRHQRGDQHPAAGLRRPADRSIGACSRRRCCASRRPHRRRCRNRWRSPTRSSCPA